MMNRRVIIALSVGSVCLLAVWWLLRSPKMQERQASLVKEQPPPPAVASTKTSKSVLADEKPAKEMEADYIKLNDRQIDFYGRAVDQYGQPVTDAEVVGSVLTPRGFAASSGEYRTKTDAEGMFQFKELVGASLGVGITKTGYEQHLGPNANTYFKYSLMYGIKNLHRPDASKPVIFNLWKLKGPEPMVEINKDFRIRHDGSPVLLDLLKGEVVPSDGDLRVVVNCPSGVRGKIGYEWDVVIGAVQGGVMESEDRFMYLAPEQGYSAEWKYAMPSSSTNWTEKVEKSFYLRSRNGRHYARVSVGVYSDSDIPGKGIGISVKSFLNPRGSRNLEFDSSKRISQRFIEQYGLGKAIAITKGEAHP